MGKISGGRKIENIENIGCDPFGSDPCGCGIDFLRVPQQGDVSAGPARLGRFPQVKKESYYNGDGTFRQATADDSMAFLMQHPVFGGYKHMFFNAEDKRAQINRPGKL